MESPKRREDKEEGSEHLEEGYNEKEPSPGCQRRGVQPACRYNWKKPAMAMSWAGRWPAYVYWR